MAESSSLGSFSIYSLALFFTITELFLFKAHSTTHGGDISVLKQFKSSLDAKSIIPGSCLSSWDFSVDPCDSLFAEKFTCGFRCDVVVAGVKRVTELAVDQAGYSGSIGQVSWNLPYLQILDLSGNNFAGSIPESISGLTRLQRLSLSGNSLTGSIPATIGRLVSLEEVYLDRNRLVGTVPTALNGLINLKRLEIQSNAIGGKFPDLGRLRNIQFIDASDNSISGELPASFPPSLVRLTIRNNRITGNIPASVTGLVSLQVLDLSGNRLTGSVPSGLFTHPSLQQLTLSYNQYGSVQVPASPIQESELIALDLSNNQIHGSLPEFLSSLPKLSALSLENNKLSGTIPTKYVSKVVGPSDGVSQLQRLILGGNYLYGAIPDPLMKMSDVGSVTIRLGDNCLYRCPLRFAFCEGGVQKSPRQCKNTGH